MRSANKVDIIWFNQTAATASLFKIHRQQESQQSQQTHNTPSVLLAFFIFMYKYRGTS